MKKTLFLLRGIPGAGKTTVGELLRGEFPLFSADDYFMENGEYKFDASLLPLAHKQCINNVISSMLSQTEKIFVANTLTTQSEMDTYFNIAKEFEYSVVSLIVENRHGHKSVHNVPQQTIERMEKRFDVKL